MTDKRIIKDAYLGKLSEWLDPSQINKFFSKQVEVTFLIDAKDNVVAAVTLRQD